MKTHLTDAGASKVAFAECRDEARRLLPKVICFSHHSESVSLRNFVRLLPKIDIGLPQLVKTTLDAKSRGVAQVKQCCYRAACTKGTASTKPDGHRFAAPQCDAGQQAHQARMGTGRYSRSPRPRRRPRKWSTATCSSRLRTPFSRLASPPRRSSQQCRAHLKGWCNMGATCFESHDTPESEIICCSKLAKDDPLWHKNFTKRRALPPNKCPYKGHEE